MRNIIIPILLLIFMVGCSSNNIERNPSDTGSKLNQEVEVFENDNQINQLNINKEDDVESAREDEIQYIDFNITGEEIVEKLSTLKITLDNETNSKYMLIFWDNKISAAIEDGEILSTVFYDSLEYNMEKRTLLLHVYSETENTYDETEEDIPVDMDYNILIKFNDVGITYYHQYGENEEVQSVWKFTLE